MTAQPKPARTPPATSEPVVDLPPPGTLPEAIVLPERDFAKLFEPAPPPTDTFLRAVKRYRKLTGK